MMKNLVKVSLMAVAALLFVQCANNTKTTETDSPMQKLQSETTWILKSMNVDSVELAVPTDQDVTISFLDSCQMAGNGGCNYYFGSYELAADTNSLKLMPSGMTRMAGPNMEFEQQFIANMMNVASYSLSDSTLTLRDSLGREIMILSQSAENPVEEQNGSVEVK